MTIEQLKQSIISSLSKYPTTLDCPYLRVGKKTYTKQDIIDSLNNNTSLGDEIIENLIGLTINLLNNKSI